MPCEECRILLEEYGLANRAFDRALNDYRECLAQGFPRMINASKCRMEDARLAANNARAVYYEHQCSHVTASAPTKTENPLHER
jgi:hypothetical protein